MINLIILACTLSLWRVSISWLCSSSTLPVSPSLSGSLFAVSLTSRLSCNYVGISQIS